MAEELNDQERRELERWRSGSLRKSWPVVESVPDGLRYAAELARAQGTEGGDEHDELLRQAAIRLRDMNDTARVLVADRDLLLWLHAEAVWHRGRLDDEALKWTEVAGQHAEEIERLHSWAGLMELLDEHWPAEVFDGQSEDSDPGPRIVSLIRAIDAERASRQAWAEEAMRMDALVREALELLNDIIGYVPEFFQEKWDYPAEIASIAARRPQCAVHPDGETA
jgi:hypothetical protein